MTEERCANCHHARKDGPPSISPWWCALQRLAAPAGQLTVAFARPYHYAFTGLPPQFTVTRSRAPGPAEGWSIDFRTGEKHRHTWNPCPEFAPVARQTAA